MAGGYSDLRKTKKRCNIPDTVKNADEKIEEFMTEADNYINTQVGLHAVTPIADPDDELIDLGSSLAAASFNYWQTPAKDRTLEGIAEWKKSIQEHILTAYGKKNPSGLTGNTFLKSNSSPTGLES